MAVTADSVVVDLIANNGQYDASVKQSASTFEDASRRTVRAANDVEGSARRVANANRNIGRQIADIGTQVAGQQSPFLIIAQQAPQVADALADVGGAAGRVAAFFAGPWGATLLAAASVSAILASNISETGDAAEEALPKLNRVQEVLADIAGISTKQVQLRIAIADIDSQLARLQRARSPGDSRVETAVINDEVRALKERRQELELQTKQEQRADQLREGQRQKEEAARKAKSEADAAARKADAEALKRQEELRNNTVKLEKAFNPLAASAREYYDVLKDISDLEKAGLINSATAEVYRTGADIARRAAALKAEGLDRPSIEDILNRPGGISDAVKRDDERIQRDIEREQEDRKRKADTEEYLFRQREQNVRSLANLYEDAFLGGSDAIWDNFKREGLRAIALLLARFTLLQFGAGGGGSFLGNLRTAASSVFGTGSGSIFGRASGGYVGPNSLHRVNETAGGVELLRMGPTGGEVIPLGRAQAAARGGTTVINAPQFNLRGAVVTRELYADMERISNESSRRAGAASYAASQRSAPGTLSQYSKLND